MRRHRDGTLRLLTFNIHVGHSIRNGTLGQLIREHRPHLLLLQEVRPADRWRLRLVLAGRYSIRGGPDSVVCVRRRPRFRVRWAVSPDNRHGEDQQRARACVCVYDRRTGRPVFAQSVHCQPLGKGLTRGHIGAVKIQHRQLQAFADASADRPEDAVVVDGGDFNQDVGVLPRHIPHGRQPYSIHRVWSRAGMVAAHLLAHTEPAKLDAFMVRPDDHLQIRRHVVIPTTRPGDDHPAVLLVLRITARARTLAEHRTEVAP